MARTPLAKLKQPPKQLGFDFGAPPPSLAHRDTIGLAWRTLVDDSAPHEASATPAWKLGLRAGERVQLIPREGATPAQHVYATITQTYWPDTKRTYPDWDAPVFAYAKVHDARGNVLEETTIPLAVVSRCLTSFSWETKR